MKPWYLSKTIWINAAIIPVLTIIEHFTGAHASAEVQVWMLAIINLILRLITKKAVTMR